MTKDLCKFDLLMVTEGYAYIDTIGKDIYSRCPNFNIHFATNVKDAISKTREHNPEVFIVDEAISKRTAFVEFQEVLQERKGIVFHLTGAKTCNRSVMGTATATDLSLSKTISSEELERKLNNVAEELFWRKLLAAGVVKPR